MPGLPLAVIALPVLAPIAALVQLLFPGLLKDQWRQYRVAMSVFLSQSTLLFAQWALVTWVVGEGQWWLAPDWLAFWVAILALGGLMVSAAFYRWEVATGEAYALGPPTFVEYLGLGLLAALGLAWMGYQLLVGGEWLDQMAITTFACVCGFVHLILRRRRVRAAEVVPTEAVLLAAIVAGGLALFFHAAPLEASGPQAAAGVEGEWPTLGLSDRRTGAAAGERDITKPKLLWTFDPGLPRGKVSFHSSPIVAGDQLFIGALHEIAGQTRGLIFSVHAGHAATGEGENRLLPGQQRWLHARGGRLMPVFATPVVAGGKLLVGEGYHQNRDCSLACIDPQSPEQPLWLHKTTSHVESTPTVVAGRIYIGAGDDGIYCLEMPAAGEPKVVWHRELFHIDSSPVIAEGKVIVGTVVGDVYFSKLVVALDEATGQVAWRYPTNHPVPGSPAYAAGRVFVGIGNGKMTEDAERPAGSVLCLTAAKGEFVWEVPVANSVLNSPAVMGERVVFTCRDGHVYCLEAASGKLVWKRDLGDPIAAAPVVTAERVYAMTVGGHVAALKLADGKVVWKLDVPSPDGDAVASPCLVAGRLYVAAGGKVHAIGETP